MEFVKKLDDDNHIIEVFHNNERIGYVSYLFKKRHKAWLNDIFVKKEYRKKGLGTILLYMFENDCHDNYVEGIEGKFYPHDEDGNVVKAFYEKHGYKILKDGYYTEIYKFGLEKHPEIISKKR